MTIWGNPYTFTPDSRQHAIVVACLLASTASIVYVARRLPRDARHRAEPFAGVVLLAIWLVANAYDATRPTSSLRDALPLHWCDVAGLLAATIFVCPNRVARSLLRMIGLCLSPLAFVLPTERHGPMSPTFWVYFVPHAAIVVAAVYDGAVRGFRPTLADARRAFLLVLAWVGLMMPVNVALDANYAYVGERDVGQRSAIVAFGPWPLRLVPLAALVGVAMLASVGVDRAIHRAGRAARRLRRERFDRYRLFSRPGPIATADSYSLFKEPIVADVASRRAA